MAIKKTQLYNHLWEAANALRGGMDASQYKDYVLTVLFVKYVTDRYKGDPYASFVVPERGSFDDLVKAKGKPDIGERINKVLANLAEKNDLKGVIDHVDFDDSSKLGSGKDKVDRLTKLIAIFENPELNFSKKPGGWGICWLFGILWIRFCLEQTVHKRRTPMISYYPTVPKSGNKIQVKLEMVRDVQ